MKRNAKEKQSGKKGNVKLVISIVIGCVVGYILLQLLIAGFFILILSGGEEEVTEDIADYSQIYEKDIDSGLIVFPDEITEEMSETKFYFSYETTWEPTVSIFLQCTYTPEEFQAEVNRLEVTRKVYGGTEKKLLRDEEGKYPYPAYVAIENHHSAYEYAMLTGENQITYIYTVYFNRDEVQFGQEYLPTDYMEEQKDQFYDGYSIYMKRVDRVEGDISYDNTKEEYVTVTDGHGLWVEDSYFTVRVQYDDQNREIITECEFAYYETGFENINLFTTDFESDNTIFLDLEGYEYRDVELDRDNTTVIITYMDEGKERKWKLDLKPYMKTRDEK